MIDLSEKELKSLYFEYRAYIENLNFIQWKERLSIEEFYQKREVRHV